MVDLMHCLINFLFFNIALLLYYMNLRPSIIRYIFCGDVYLSFGISIDSFFVYGAVSGLFHEAVLIILSVVLLPIKSFVACALFLN